MNAEETIRQAGLRRSLVKPPDDGTKERLKDFASKKVTTAFVGALACFEEAFGHLWGHGYCWEDLTEDEREWFEIWRECRAAILDKGNDQAKALLEVVERHDVRRIFGRKVSGG